MLQRAPILALSPASRSVLFRASARRSLVSIASSEFRDLGEGERVHGFVVKKIRDIKDFDMTAVHLQHEKTGADHMHIFKDDSNNVFNVGFQTAPHDSTGVPHILEHTTLCGSDRYPVRDPFFKMMNRSAATFMNAMTYSDMTMYPFSTENRADYENLFSVYMDAVFSPRLRETDFRQEGWRLEHETVGDSKSPIVFKGVVYNEMKGVYSDVNNIFFTRLQESIFPNTIYANNSGGDPAAITELTHAQLLDFHRRNYHPSNARFFTYGNFPLLPTLEAIDAKISRFERLKERELIRPVSRFAAPRRVDATCPFNPVGDPEKQTRMCITYLTNDGLDAFESFAVSVLSNLLTDGAASPFYKALIESNIGSDYSPATGYDRTSVDTVFSVGLQGIRYEDVEHVERLIREVFEKFAVEGFENERVESVLHQLELSIRHRKANFGMGLSQGVLQHWIHGGDPFDAMEVTKFVARLREELKTPGFFQSLVKKYFIDNPHRLLLVMKPDESYAEAIKNDESARLQRKLSSLSEAERTEILESGLELKKIQETPDDVSCLPTLQLSDLPSKTKTYPVTFTSSPARTQWRATTTNGITYLRLTKSLTGLPQDLIPYVPLYCDSLTALGTRSTPSIADLDERIRATTSGVAAAAQISTDPTAIDDASSRILFSTSFLDSKASDAFNVFREVVAETDHIDKPEVRERLNTVLAAASAGSMNSLAGSGHRYAVKVASRGVSRPGEVKEVMGGVESVKFLNGLVAADRIEDVLEKVRMVGEFVNRAEGAVEVAVNCLESSVGGNEVAVRRLVDGLGWRCDAPSFSPESSKVFAPEFTDTFIPLPFSVNYTARVFRGVPYTHPDGPSLQILAELLTHRYLHREVREKGGAYGASTSYDAISGILSMSSYRDPPGAGQRTMDAFERAVRFAVDVKSNVSETELAEAKLSLLGRMDAVVSASQEGMVLFTTGITDEMRQRRRELLFQVTFDSLRDVAEKYLAGARSSRAVLGPADEVRALEGWKTIDFGNVGSRIE